MSANNDVSYNIRRAAFWFVVSILMIVSYLTLGDLIKFADGKYPFIVELMAAILGSIVTVSAMAVMMKIQVNQDKERAFHAKLYENKLTLYKQLLTTIIEADDDNILGHKEMMSIENDVALSCLIAGENLVSLCSQFVIQLKLYGVLYYRSMDEEQRAHFVKLAELEKTRDLKHSLLAAPKHEIARSLKVTTENAEIVFVSLDDLIQGLRTDLEVVDGDIQHDVENFARMPFNKDKMIRFPTVIEWRRSTDATEETS